MLQDSGDDEPETGREPGLILPDGELQLSNPDTISTVFSLSETLPKSFLLD